MYKELNLTSFESFINQDWHLRYPDFMMEADEALYRGSGTQSQVPYLQEEDDWKFLTQFPPFLWKKAYEWRFNQGMLATTLEREKTKETHPEQQHPVHRVTWDDNVMPNYVQEIVLEDDDGKKYIFHPDPYRGVKDESGHPALFVGLRDKVQELEKPIKLRKTKVQKITPIS